MENVDLFLLIVGVKSTLWMGNIDFLDRIKTPNKYSLKVGTKFTFRAANLVYAYHVTDTISTILKKEVENFVKMGPFRLSLNFSPFWLSIFSEYLLELRLS